MDSNHRSRRERDGRGGGGPRPTIVVSRDDLCLMTPVQLIGPAGNSRETLFAKSGTDGSNPVPSSEESCELRYGRRRPADQVVKGPLWVQAVRKRLAARCRAAVGVAG